MRAELDSALSKCSLAMIDRDGFEDLVREAETGRRVGGYVVEGKLRPHSIRIDEDEPEEGENMTVRDDLEQARAEITRLETSLLTAKNRLRQERARLREAQARADDLALELRGPAELEALRARLDDLEAAEELVTAVLEGDCQGVSACATPSS